MAQTRSKGVDKSPAKRDASAEPVDSGDADTRPAKSAKRDRSPAEADAADVDDADDKPAESASSSKANDGDEAEETLEHGHIHFMMRPRTSLPVRAV